MNNLYLIIGEDDRLIDFYLNDILSKIEYSESDKIVYDMNVSNFTDVLDEASTISLFSLVKVIIGNNFDITKMSDNECDYLDKYIKDNNKNTYIILIAAKVDARSKKYKLFKDGFKIIDTNKEDNNNLVMAYVNKKIKDNSYSISSFDLEYFINRVGNDIHNIDLELDKLFIYKEEDKKITREDIDLLTIDNIDNVIYEFTNAVLERDIDKIKLMYDNFKKENVSVDYLISSLASVFRQVLMIKLLQKEGKSNFEISKVIGKKEFFVKKMFERTYEYKIDDIKNAIIKLAKIELDIKSGKSSIDMFEIFLYDIKKGT